MEDDELLQDLDFKVPADLAQSLTIRAMSYERLVLLGAPQIIQDNAIRLVAQALVAICYGSVPPGRVFE